MIVGTAATRVATSASAAANCSAICRSLPGGVAAQTLQPAAQPGGVADRQPVEAGTQLGDGRFGHPGKDSCRRTGAVPSTTRFVPRRRFGLHGDGESSNPECLFRLVLLVALCASVVSGCTAPPGGTPGGTATPPGLPTFTAPTTTTGKALPTGPLVAYRASKEIGLADGTRIVATAPGDFTPSTEPLVTEDGRFVFARSADGKVVTLDAHTGANRVIPLPQAARLGTAGASMIVWWEQPNRLMQLDLAADAVAPTLRQTVNLPPVAYASDPALLTARNGTAVISRVETTPSPSGGPDTLYAVRGGGAPTSLGAADANTPVAEGSSAPTARASPTRCTAARATPVGRRPWWSPTPTGPNRPTTSPHQDRRPAPRFFTCGGRSRTRWR